MPTITPEAFQVLALILLSVIALAFVASLFIRSPTGAIGAVAAKVDALAGRQADSAAALDRAMAAVRDELSKGAREGRGDLADRLDQAAKAQEERATSLRLELVSMSERLGAGVGERLQEVASMQERGLGEFAARLGEHRERSGAEASQFRTDVSERLDGLSSGMRASLRDFVDGMSASAEQLRSIVDKRLDEMRVQNGEKLDAMRSTVEEKLDRTLEARFNDSFQKVSDDLVRVTQAVGEMKSVAAGVSDLKAVLANVKTRGIWGEVSLGMVLEEYMTVDQYATNVEVVPNTGERVEFAIRLPGDGGPQVWLPIDAKFPQEDYQRLVDASETGDPAGVEAALKALERSIKLGARDISMKYVQPPHSTNFGVMYLPTEGLFLEVVKRPGLVDVLQREHRVIVAGPSTLMSMLMSLRVGFQTLMIKERAGEIMQVLGAVKTEFGKFGSMIDKVEKKLGEAQTVVGDLNRRRRAVDRKLRVVEALPDAAASRELELSAHEAVLEVARSDMDGVEEGAEAV